ncbi:50S ribosomal protein L10 [Frankia sp. AiPs1]|uniref:50S ribosomal protein L10 n=1 Tax=Frankia sp. AiPs1 TaxID=573493 RepID=UPI002044344E|nr:50S ribosomal protein L10 [Frankia sp. AiPs1]MCM3921418.1 50S ribosomal protein L10 [Frankia sp. AiPs1]
MARPEKTAAVAEIAEEFRGATAAVLTEYRGLTVSQLTELRRTLGEGARYAVVKNTLTKIAAEQAGVTGLDDLFVGPTAVAFVTGDPVEAAKGLRDFARANPALVVKGGVVEGKAMTADDIRKLADLESREILLAKLAGAMKGSLSGAVGLFAAPLSQVARLAEALREQRASQSAAEPAAVEAPASEPAEAAEAPAE